MKLFLRRGRWLLVGTLIAALMAGCGSSADDDAGGETSASIGTPITRPVDLAPFSPSDEAGAKPNVPKVIAYAQSSTNETEQAIATGLRTGAADAGLQFTLANSNGDPQKQVQNMQQFLVKGIGALVTGPVDPASQAPVLRDAIERGIAAFTIVFGPGTSQANASQYAVGETLAVAAADYIETRLGGRANVVLMNQDNLPPIVPRFRAIRDVLTRLPGVKIVADVTPKLNDSEHGFETMNTILQKNPEVDVVLAADTLVQGALAALEAAHKANDRQFLGGLDGNNSALDAIAKGGPIKATVGLAPTIFAYGWAQFAGDWFTGKHIPQAMDVIPASITSAADVEAYRADEQDPASVWNDPQRRAKYVQLYGDISYETRGRYLAYNWTK
jgi:ribose transport system substrate-binding protein